MERYKLAMERITQIPYDTGVDDRFHDFFCKVSNVIKKCDEIKQMRLEGTYLSHSLDELIAIQDDLYKDMLPKNYEHSYLKPSVACDKLGTCGVPLSTLYKEVYAIPGLIAMADEEKVTRILELFLEIYSLFTTGDTVTRENIEAAIYWYAFDYLDDTVHDRLKQVMDPGESFVSDIVTESNLGDYRYLFDFGVYISDTELKVAEYLNSLDQTIIDKMASVYTEGFREGYIAGRKDLSKKDAVQIRYSFGFDRIVKSAIGMFSEMGLTSICTMKPIILTDRSPLRNVGCGSLGVNRQCEYDHRYDSSIFYDKAYTDRRMTMLSMSYNSLRELSDRYAGPAVIEVFGEEDFNPIIDDESYVYSTKQKKLQTKVSSDAVRLQNEYIPSEEISFTIIAWPLPSIGDNYKEIFDDIIRINTLEAGLYRKLQQHIIDELDKCEFVQVLGTGANHTDIKVKLRKLSNPKQETKFENCVADVNIPLGEVFTSPVLEGTKGRLEVSSVYIDGYKINNLKMDFDDGMIIEYGCTNYEDDADNKKLIDDLILKNHKTLPMGEFAIGTNTVAYSVAKKYGIIAKLPILIVEKMGPHFAVGDTCYSFEEDVMTYNPDGKAIVARDNTISNKRYTSPEEAYFGCHTDITIPYDEIGAIYGVRDDGKQIYIIRDGRFVLDGMEELNKEL